MSVFKVFYTLIEDKSVTYNQQNFSLTVLFFVVILDITPSVVLVVNLQLFRLEKLRKGLSGFLTWGKKELI